MNTELLIDDRAVAVERLGFHAQDEAFPGGHRFALQLIDAGLAADLCNRFGAVVSAPSKSDAHLIFEMLSSVISFRRLKNPAQPLAYLANSISSLRLENDTVVCSGICSAVANA